MDNRLLALKLILDGLDVPDDISTLDDRKRVQKAVYLGQRAGIELGYRFGWYLLGPYSSPLARDYYALATQLQAAEKDPTAGRALRPAAKSALDRILPIMTPPEGVDLTQEDWLELLASLDYLRTVSGLTHQQSVETMEGSPKQRLVRYAAEADAKLREVGLLAA